MEESCEWWRMTKTTANHGDLAAGIERLVRESISTIHVTAQAAVERHRRGRRRQGEGAVRGCDAAARLRRASDEESGR